jgi:PIN domain nuclease of toxin-antitoxin system
VTFLVDTHVFLWAFRSPAEVSDRAREILSDPGAKLLISIVVPWEIAIKSTIGKLKGVEEILDNFEGLMSAGGYQILETSTKQVIESGRLPPHHKDPFDRLLAAQALDLRVPIVSSNDVFDRYGVRRIWN